jgi:acyl-CoA synthetase (AMP-forming)/AMP-acid ligase II
MCEFSGAYGLTETLSTVCLLEPADHRLEGSSAEIEVKLRRLGSVGRPVADVEMRIIGAGGQSDVTGEVAVRASRSASGYWRDEDSIDGSSREWVNTGDIGYFDEAGYLFLVGRKGDMIVRGGENISPRELEEVIYAHPEILDVAVVGVPDEEWGQRIVAAVVLVDGARTSLSELRDFCKQHLASFKVPERFEVVNELPRTSTGKVVRRRLIDIFSA